MHRSGGLAGQRLLTRNRPVVLMHHGFATTRRDDDPEALFVTEDALRCQLEYLRRHRWTALDLDGYLRAIGGGRRSSRDFLFTVDDGYVSVATLAAPLLARFGVPLVLFVPSGLIGKSASWLTSPRDEPLLDRDALRELSRQGVEIGAHGFEHRSMAGLDDAQLRRGCVDVREQLADVVGRPPRAFAYPFGHFDLRAQAAVEAAGYEVAFSVHEDAGPFGISRVDINATDTVAHFRLKLLPGYRRVWRAAGRLGPLRPAVRKTMGYRRTDQHQTGADRFPV